MKSKIFRALLLLLPITYSALSLANDRVLQICQADGQVITIKLEEEPFAVFKGDTLLIKSKSQELMFNLEGGASIQALYIVSEETSINTFNDSKPFLNVKGDYIEGSGWQANSTFILYDINGKKIREATVNKNGNIKLPLKKKGIFLLKTSFSTIKINNL